MFQLPPRQQFPQLFRDQPHQQSRCDRSFSHSLQPACEHDRQDARDHDQRHVKSHFHVTELDFRKHFADREHNALARQHYDSCFNFKADSHSYQQDADETYDPLLPVCITGDPLNSPHAEVREVTEEKRHRELHELDRMIILSQDQDL